MLVFPQELHAKLEIISGKAVGEAMAVDNG